MKFGRLTVCGEPYIKRYRKNASRRHCACRCDCGGSVDVTVARLVRGETQSCGCLQRERTGAANRTHGGGRTRLYATWIGMKSRCGNPKNKSFDRYGQRGIKICPEWENDFPTFRAWALANGYRDDLTIERKEVNGDYEPSNCTWIPLEDQGRNTARVMKILAFGETKTLADWSRDPRCRTGYLTLYNRLKNGWEPETAITTPSQDNRHDVTAFDKTKTICDWLRDPRCVVCNNTLRNRLRSGWNAEAAITTPPKQKPLPRAETTPVRPA